MRLNHFSKKKLKVFLCVITYFLCEIHTVMCAFQPDSLIPNQQHRQLLPIIHLETINANLEYMRLYALQRKDKKTCDDLLKLVNDMENVIFNEHKSFTQLSIDNYLKE